MKDLQEILNRTAYEMLEEKLDHYWLNHGIKFKLLFLNDEEAAIGVSQNWRGLGNHLDNKQLYNLANEIFSLVLAPRNIKMSTVAYIESPADAIDPTFLRSIQSKNQIKLKNLQADLGIHKTRISHWMTGKLPMNKATKNMFYWYLVANKYIVKRPETSGIQKNSTDLKDYEDLFEL